MKIRVPIQKLHKKIDFETWKEKEKLSYYRDGVCGKPKLFLSVISFRGAPNVDFTIRTNSGNLRVVLIGRQLP